jgi:hypothetical protein
LEKILDKTPARKPLEKLKDRLTPYIELWKKTLEAQNTSDAATKPLRNMCAQNLFYVYAILENTEEAKKYAAITEETADDIKQYTNTRDYAEVMERIQNIEANRQFTPDLEAGKVKRYIEE